MNASNVDNLEDLDTSKEHFNISSDGEILPSLRRSAFYMVTGKYHEHQCLRGERKLIVEELLDNVRRLEKRSSKSDTGHC